MSPATGGGARRADLIRDGVSSQHGDGRWLEAGNRQQVQIAEVHGVEPATMNQAVAPTTARQATAWAAEVDVPELTRLATTIDRWRAEALAYFCTGGASSGRVEAVNGETERVDRTAPGLPIIRRRGYPDEFGSHCMLWQIAAAPPCRRASRATRSLMAKGA